MSAQHGARRGTPDEPVLAASLLEPPNTGATVSADRSRLRDLLTRASEGSLVLVTGTPAAGKTTLVADWLRNGFNRQRPTAWLTARNLGDEVLFWRYLLAAVGSLGVDTADLRGSLEDDARPTRAWLTELANRIGDVEGRPLLVIDDLHEVTDHAAIDSLQALIEHLPPTATLIVMTRAEPSWPLSAWRMSGRLRTIGSQDLRFSEADTRELAERLGASELDGDDIARLTRRTDGWAGGVKLALLALQTSGSPKDFVDELDAVDETVSSYLVRDVLDGQDPELRRFLLDISVLDELTPDLCDAVLDRTDSRDLLERCQVENLFITAVDRRRGSCRLHPLFGQLIAAHQRTTDPERWAEIHRRASRVHEDRGEIRLAIAHAIELRDDGRVGSLIARNAPDFAQRGRFDEIRSWVSTMAADTATGLPEATFGLLLALILSGRVQEALSKLDEVADARPAPRFRYGLEQLRGMALMLGGDVDRLREVAASLDREVPEGELTLPFLEERLVAYFHGVGSYFAGDLDDAAASFDRASRSRERPGIFYAESPGWMALTEVGRGHLRLAEQWGRRSIERQIEIGTGETAVKVPAQLALALAAWERDELAAADEALSIARRSVSPLPWEMVLVENARSRLRASLGDVDGATSDLLEIGKLFLGRSGAPSLRGLVADRLIDLYLRADDVETADLWRHTFRGATGREPRASLRIRLAQARDEHDLAETVRTALSGHDLVPERLNVLLAAATVELGLGARDRALELTGQAVSLGSAEGHVRRFCDAGPVVAHLLHDLTKEPEQMFDSVARFFLAKLVAECSTERPAQVVRRPVADELVEQLTERELEVLSLLEKGLTYARIGELLYVSRNTVKSHVQHIYTKLGVSNRPAASAEAQRLGLL